MIPSLLPRTVGAGTSSLSASSWVGPMTRGRSLQGFWVYASYAAAAAGADFFELAARWFPGREADFASGVSLFSGDLAAGGTDFILLPCHRMIFVPVDVVADVASWVALQGFNQSATEELFITICPWFGSGSGRFDEVQREQAVLT